MATNVFIPFLRKAMKSAGSLLKHDVDGKECNLAFLQSLLNYSKPLCLENVCLEFWN